MGCMSVLKQIMPVALVGVSGCQCMGWHGVTLTMRGGEGGQRIACASPCASVAVQRGKGIREKGNDSAMFLALVGSDMWASPHITSSGYFISLSERRLGNVTEGLLVLTLLLCSLVPCWIEGWHSTLASHSEVGGHPRGRGL